MKAIKRYFRSWSRRCCRWRECQITVAQKDGKREEGREEEGAGLERSQIIVSEGLDVIPVEEGGGGQGSPSARAQYLL